MRIWSFWRKPEIQPQPLASKEALQQAAHDIRSPLTALRLAIQTLPELPDEHRRVILMASARIHAIAEDILRPSSTPPKVLAAQTLQQIVENVVREKQMLSPDVTIAQEVDDITAEACAVDALSFARVISNLIDNCLQAFQRKGNRIRIRLAVQGRHLICKIIDNGPGIDERQLPKLGQRGYSLGKGSGLGLYHAKTQVEAWQGTLRIESQPDVGTCVQLTLPCL